VRPKDSTSLDELKARLDAAKVPVVLATTSGAAEGAEVPVSLFFRDPDQNQLELRCSAYPFRPDIQVGPFDPSLQQYRWADWRAQVPDGGAPAQASTSIVPVPERKA
jgi:hypothetical protein